MKKARPETRGGVKAIAPLVEKLTRPILGRRGFGEARIVTEWASIVGAVLARHSVPMRIAYPRGERGGGTLHLRVASGAMALELQHVAPLVLERINAFFGYQAVARLTISQGPLPRPAAAPRQKPAAADPAVVARHLDGVADEELRAALARLGGAVLAGKR